MSLIERSLKQGQYNRFPTAYPIHSLDVLSSDSYSEIVVERDGYISKQQQLEELKHAGRNLENYRMQSYQGIYPEDLDDPHFDPTQEHSFTEMDAMDMARDLNDRLKSARKKRQEAEKRLQQEARPPAQTPTAPEPKANIEAPQPPTQPA